MKWTKVNEQDLPKVGTQVLAFEDGEVRVVKLSAIRTTETETGTNICAN